MSEPGGSDPNANEQLLRDGYAAFNARDVERLRELMVEDFRWNEAAEVPGRKVCRSAEEFVRYVETFERIWDEFGFEVLRLTPAGADTVVAEVKGRGRGKASDHAFELPIHHVWRFRDGRVARMDAFLDPGEARDAAGLR